MSSAAYQNISLDWQGPIARITLNRPEKLNPLDWSTVKELKSAVAEIDARPGALAAVITGSGRSFSAGGDLDGYIGLYRRPDDFAQFLEDFRQMLVGIESSSRIFVAAINGVCVAGGLELLLACDIVYAADTARIGDGHVNFGQLPGAGGSQRLPRAVGLTEAKHLILTGDLLPAAEAMRIGLVNKVVPAADLEAAVTALTAKFQEKSPVGLATAKRLANMTLEHGLSEGLAREIAVVHRYATTEHDATEGLIAFKEKRKPNFKG